MSTCKFFLQGTCKYGDTCKYSHQIDDTSQIRSATMLRQQPKPPTVDTSLLVKSVVNDMVNAEKGSHWLLSSYAPFKDKLCFPGFENRSFEEVRFGYYEAVKNNTIEQYKQQLQAVLQDAVMKMKALQNPTNEIVSMLIQIYNTPVKNQNVAGSFGQSQTSFGQTQSTFRQNQTAIGQTQSGFAQGPSGFGQNQTGHNNTSIFSLANQQFFGNSSNQPQSIFGRSTANAINIFNGAAQQNSNQNVGGGQSIFNTQPPFVANSNNPTFANTNFETSTTVSTQSSPFSIQSSPFTTQNSIFNQPGTMQNNIFSQPTTPSSNFGQLNSAFNANSNFFSKQTKPTPFQSQGSGNSPLGNKGQAANSSIFATQHPPFSFPNAGNIDIPASAALPFAAPSQQNSIFANSGVQNNATIAVPAFTQNTNQNVSPFQQQSPNITPGNSNVFASKAFAFNTQSTNTGQNLTNSIFGQASDQLSSTGLRGGAEEINSRVYSKLEDLTEAEIKSFESEAFEFGKIPEQPPTAQMCN